MKVMLVIKTICLCFVTGLAQRRTMMPRILLSSNNSRAHLPLVTLLTEVNFGGDWQPLGSLCTEAMRLALDQLIQELNLLPGYNIALDLNDDQCADDVAISTFIGMVENAFVPSTGPSKSNTFFPLVLNGNCPATGQIINAMMMNNFNLIGLTVLPQTAVLHQDRNRFRNFYTLALRADEPFVAMVEFIVHMGWRKVAIITENIPYHNANEVPFLALLDHYNVSLVWMGKIFDMSNEAEVVEAFTDMKSREPRIFISNNDSPVPVSCYMHRFGMTGSNRIVFWSYWSYYDPASVEIPKFLPWCTRKMLAQAVQSAIFYGNSKLIEINGPDKTVDTSGLVGTQFIERPKQRVPDAEKSFFWNFWPPICYDQVLYSGYLLNKTEELLIMRNETLADWMMNGRLFQQNGNEIADVIRQALYSIRVSGMRGEYEFEARTSGNSRGYTPISFSQQIKGASEIVAIYKSSATVPIIVRPDKIKWRTVGNRPPRDSILNIYLQIPLIPKSGTFILVAISALSIFGCIGVTMLVPMFRRIPTLSFGEAIPVSQGDLAIAFGDVIMLCHILIIPTISEPGHGIDMATYCSTVGTLIAIGFTLSISAIYLKLLSYRKWKGAPFNDEQNEVGKVKTIETCGCLIWTIIHGVLIGVFLFKLSPLKVSPIIAGKQVAENDSSLVFIQIKQQCHFADENWFSNEPSLAVFIIMALLQLGFLLQEAFLSYKMRASRIPNVKRISACIFCECTLILATIFIILVQSSNGLFVHLAISSFTVFYVFVNLALIAATTVFTRRSGNIPLPLSTLTRGTTAHRFATSNRLQSAAAIGQLVAN